MARAIGRGLALLFNNFNNDMRYVTQKNIELTQPTLSSQEQALLVKKSLSHTLMNALEMPIIWQRDNRWLDTKIHTIENASVLKTSLDMNQGVIVVCPHVGNWEVFGRYLPRHASTTNLYQPPKYTFLENLVKNGREKSGANLVPTNQRGIAQLLKALRRGEITGILPDQVPKNDSGLFVPFLGQQAFTMTLIHSLISKTGCRVVLGYALRDAKGFKVIFKEIPEAIYSSDISLSVLSLSQGIEMTLEEEFSQYQWSYKRFKKQPDGKPRPYQKK